MYLSTIALDGSRWDIVQDLQNRDLLHKKVMLLFPRSEFPDPRKRFGILFREEKNRILLQSNLPPNERNAAPGYRILMTKDVAVPYSRINKDAEYRFRLDANTSWRVDDVEPEWIPHTDVRVKQTQKRVGCGSYPERARWFEQKMNMIGVQPVKYFMESLHILRVKDGVLEATRFEGTLKVLDLEPFKKALYDGVGQGKPYGLGMMSIASA